MSLSLVVGPSVPVPIGDFRARSSKVANFALVAAGSRREGALLSGRLPAQRQECVQSCRGGLIGADPQEAAQLAAAEPRRRVKVSVQDHLADLAGEHVGVGRPEQGAVRDAVVVKLRLAQRLPHEVEIASAVGGRDMGQQRVVAPGAVLVQLGMEVGPFGLLGPG